MKKWINILILCGFLGGWMGLFVIQFPDLEFLKTHQSGIFKLNGAFVKEKDTTISLSTWFNRDYQKRKEAYLNDNFFPRAFFVKTSNQYEYSLFKEINAEQIYEGKNGYLFRFYMDNFKPSYNFQGKEKLDSTTNTIKQLQIKLDNKGTKLIPIITPDKARICAEHLPDVFKENEAENNNNYREYLNLFRKKEINYIDFNEWFLQIRDTSKVPLFAKTGVHWTQSASYYALDSLQRYFEQTKGIKYAKMKRKKIPGVRKPWNPDIDASVSMNLFIPPEELNIPYFDVFSDSSENKKPKVMVISDSFWDAPSWSGYDKLLFQEQEYWYYARTFRNYKDPERPITMQDYERLTDYDFIVVLCTEMNLSDFGWGFFDNALQSITENE